MIGRLRGEVIDRTSSTLLIDVGGVGYVVTVSQQCPHKMGDRVDLHIHTHVREDALQLFGFADPVEREVFHLLLSVPSIGPVKAMSVLATPFPDIIEYVQKRQPERLAKLPGVGKKTAERMVVDLYDKMSALRTCSPSTPQTGGASLRPRVADDLTSALINLGFRPADAEAAAAGALERLGEAASLEPLLRDALVHLGPR